MDTLRGVWRGHSEVRKQRLENEIHKFTIYSLEAYFIDGRDLYFKGHHPYHLLDLYREAGGSVGRQTGPVLVRFRRSADEQYFVKLLTNSGIY